MNKESIKEIWEPVSIKKVTSWKLEHSSTNAPNRTTGQKTAVLAGKDLVVTACLDTINGARDNRSDEHRHVQAFLQRRVNMRPTFTEEVLYTRRPPHPRVRLVPRWPELDNWNTGPSS